MKLRYQLRTKDGRFIEAECNQAGHDFLAMLRVMLPDLFKRKRIRSIIQAYPSQIETGKFYKLGGVA